VPQVLGHLLVVQILARLFLQQFSSQGLSWRQLFSQEPSLPQQHYRYLLLRQFSLPQLSWQELSSWQAFLPQAAHCA
jgi:hypothetical protein